MKDYEPERQPSIEISTQASAEQHWQALDRSALGPRSVLLYAERLSEALDLRSMLSTGQIMAVQVAGDPAEDGAVLDFAYVQGLRKQCIAADVPFHFAGTGTNFQMKGRMFHIPAKLQASQAAKAEMEYFPICLAMNAPVPALDHAPSIFDQMSSGKVALPDADGFAPVSFNPFEDGEDTAQENAHPEDEDPTFFGSLEHPSVKNLHYTIEVSDDDDDYQGASAEDHLQLEECERARKSSAQVQFLQESLRLAEDGGHP